MPFFLCFVSFDMYEPVNNSNLYLPSQDTKNLTHPHSNLLAKSGGIEILFLFSSYFNLASATEITNCFLRTHGIE